MKLAERLLELRNEENISRETLAKAIGVHRLAVAYWENGINEPKTSYIIKLAEFFGVPTDYLLGLEN